jgi:hypothetical protein
MRARSAFPVPVRHELPSHLAVPGGVRGWADGLDLGGLRLEGGLDVAIFVRDGPGNANALVGEGGGDLAVTELTNLGSRRKAQERRPSLCSMRLGVPEDRACAMDEEHAQVGIAAPGGPARSSARPREYSRGVKPRELAMCRPEGRREGSTPFAMSTATRVSFCMGWASFSRLAATTLALDATKS